MARIAIEMPGLGHDMESGIVGAWIKQIGITAARGDVLTDIVTERCVVPMSLRLSIA